MKIYKKWLDVLYVKNRKSNREHLGGWMGDLKVFNKDLYVIPNSFTLRDVKDNIFY